jgi:predicted nucleic acid-binding protein
MPDCKKVIISDTSCLIGLTNINYLNLLRQLYETVIITPEVADEFGTDLPEWINIIPVRDNRKTDEIYKTLDLGESSSIALAIETSNSLLIIDETKGRDYAKKLGINIIGTLGLLIKAHKTGLLPDIDAILKSLRKNKFRIPEDAEKYFV